METFFRHMAGLTKFFLQTIFELSSVLLLSNPLKQSLHKAARNIELQRLCFSDLIRGRWIWGRGTIYQFPKRRLPWFFPIHIVIAGLS
jgi:hypothetical protein